MVGLAVVGVLLFGAEGICKVHARRVLRGLWLVCKQTGQSQSQQQHTARPLQNTANTSLSSG